MINPFLTSSSSNNTFTSNLYSNNKTNDIFKTNNNNNNFNQNTYNPFKVNNNNNNINTTNNNNDIFSRINATINDNTSNNNNFMNNMNNPFRTGNTTNANMFNNNTNMFNNGSNFSFQNQNFQNMKEYNFGFGLNPKLAICETAGKSPITTFENNIKYIREYAEKNKIGQMEYSKTKLEYICNDENLKNFCIEEIRANDYINAKIQFFDKWSNDIYNPNKENNNQTNYSGINNFTSNILNNNNNNNNTFSIFNQNNNNGNNNTNPFINLNNNNNNIFNNNNNNGNTNYNPFNNNNNNGSKLNFLNNNNNIFNNNNNINNNPFANQPNKNIFNTNNNMFNNNTSNSPFNTNNNFLNNNNNNNPFNNNNTNNMFNRNNNIFNNNPSNNIFNTNANNNNIFNNNIQNPFNSVLNKNINISTNNYFNNNSINNNNFANNIFNNNMNNFMDKPFEEKIKDPTWVKRNVRILSNKDLDNWFEDYLGEISKINLKIKEMEYFSDKDVTKTNSEEENSYKNDLIFNKIILSTDEEILKYNMEKEKEEKNSEKNKRYNIEEEEKNIETEYENIYKEQKRWDPINIKNNNNEILENIYTLKNENLRNNNYKNNKRKISGFEEASKILSNFDDDYVDFNLNNKEQNEFILPTEKKDFFKFNNNMMSNRQSYMSPSVNNNNKIYNNNNINEDMDIISNNSNNYYNVSNGMNSQKFDMNVFENKDSVKNENLIKNNIINNTNSNRTTKINSDEINRNLIIMEENIIKEDDEKNVINQNECKLIYLGESGNIEELKIPIIIQFSSIILPNENMLNFDSIIDIIIKNIKSIENIQDKILLPKKEDIYLKLDGKIYSKLTTTEININQVDKYIDNENNYYYIYYGFKLKQYPLIINDINDMDHKYITNPKLEDILNPVNNYDLKKIENFQIWNKYGKIIFIDPIDLSGKIIINDIIKINEGDIDLSHNRVDKLKARAFLYYDFGDKIEGTYLENIKYMLQTDKGNFVKYENKILEYTINC